MSIVVLMRHRWPFLALWLATAALSACARHPPVAEKQPAPARPAPAASISPEVHPLPEKLNFELDLDSDGRPDPIELTCYGNGSFDTFRYALSTTGGQYLFRTDDGEWGPPHENDLQLFPAPNLSPRRDMYIHRFPEAGLLIFLFRTASGEEGESVTVLRADRHGLSRYFLPGEFTLDRFLAPDGSGPWRMAARIDTAQAFGDTESDEGLETYSPTVVYRLGVEVTIDEDATERLTRQRYNGYAGHEPREDVAVVHDKDGTSHLITWPGKKPFQ